MEVSACAGYAIRGVSIKKLFRNFPYNLLRGKNFRRANKDLQVRVSFYRYFRFGHGI
jgi:hypothetical protein